jgi:hypothetical protein
MSTAALNGVRLKLVRAEEHFKAIQSAVAGLNNARCEMTPEECLDDKNFGVLRIHLTPKPPLALSTVIGDFLFNVRSSLDHLVWQLVLSNNGKPCSSNMFPISDKPKDFDNAVKQDRLQGVAVNARTLIESLQPYNAGNEPLQTLSRLHNFDKHRTLNLTTAVASSTSVQWSDESGPSIGMFIGDQELRDGAIYGDISMPFITTTMREKFFNMKVQGHAATFIAFDNATADELEPFRVDTVLQEILDFTRDKIISTFELFFV